MLKTWKIAMLAGVLLAGTAGAASADSRVRIGVSIGTPIPVVVGAAPVYYRYPAPAVVYTSPAPVYYYYYPPEVYYAPSARVVYYGHGHRHGRHHHRHWR